MMMKNPNKTKNVVFPNMDHEDASCTHTYTMEANVPTHCLHGLDAKQYTENNFCSYIPTTDMLYQPQLTSSTESTYNLYPVMQSQSRNESMKGYVGNM